MTFALGLILTTAFWPFVAAPADLPRWAIFGIVLPFLLLHRQAKIPLPVLLFFGWAVIQGLWVIDGWRWLQGVWHLAVIVMAIAYGSSLNRNEWGRFVFGALVGVVVNIAIMLAQIGGWTFIPQAQPPAGLQANKNFLGELIVIVLAATRIPWLGVVAVLTTAKGAVLAWAIGMVAHRGRYRGVFLGIGVVAVIALAWHERVGFETSSTAARMTLWANALAMTLDNPLGHGVGSFWTLYPKFHDAFLNWNTATYTGMIRPETPHNDIILIMVEYGIPGLFLIGIIGYRTYILRSQAPDAANALLAFVCCGLFGFPFREPASALFVGVALGHLLGLGAAVRGEWLQGGGPLFQGAHRAL